MTQPPGHQPAQWTVDPETQSTAAPNMWPTYQHSDCDMMGNCKNIGLPPDLNWAIFWFHHQKWAQPVGQPASCAIASASAFGSGSWEASDSKRVYLFTSPLFRPNNICFKMFWMFWICLKDSAFGPRNNHQLRNPSTPGGLFHRLLNGCVCILRCSGWTLLHGFESHASRNAAIELQP